MDREYKSSLKCLRIGDKIAELPYSEEWESESAEALWLGL